MNRCRRQPAWRNLLPRLLPVVAIPLLHAAVASAATRYVSPSGSHTPPFTNWATASTNVRIAVSAAAAGDTVLVTNGVYGDENTIVISNALTLVSVNGAASTVLDHLGYAGRVINVTAPGTRISGFSIIRGYAAAGGGGVYLGAGSVLDACKVAYNTGGTGGGVYAGEGSVVTNCWIRENSTSNTGTKRGGGIYCATGVVVDCVIEKNSAYFGGGIVSAGAMIDRCLISSNYAAWGGGVEGYGGGLYFEGGGTATHCRVERNTCFGPYKYGGGVYFASGGLLRNSLVWSNDGNYGGGAFVSGNGGLESCTIAGNAVVSYGLGGGLYVAGGLDAYNTIIAGNVGGSSPDVAASGGNFDHCLSPTYLYGIDNVWADPLFIHPEGRDFHLSPVSPGRDTGASQSWMTGATDLDGRLRVISTAVDIGAYELDYACDFTGTPREATVPMTVTFTGIVAEAVGTVNFRWDFEDDGVVDAEGVGSAVVTNTYTNIGAYAVRLSVSNTTSGATATVVKTRYVGAYPAEVFVSLSGSHTPPFTSWETAATNLNDAAAQGLAGTVVWVTNGTYFLTAGVTVPRHVTLQSVNGADVTVIHANGGAYRCVLLSSPGGVLRGFTITRGTSGGGGVYAGPDTRVSDCIIVSNSALRGGGVEVFAGAVVSNCLIAANVCGDSDGGGGVYAIGGEIVDCVISNNVSPSAYGGAGVMCESGTRVRRCVVTHNRSGFATGWQQGAGINATASTIEDCVVSYNSCPTYYAGGGILAYAGTVVSGCTVVANTGYEAGGIYLHAATATRCVIECNTGASFQAGGVYIKSGTLDSSVVRRNWAVEAGAGVAILNGSIRNCLIADNAAGRNTLGSGGGGVYCGNSGTIENSTIAGNDAGAGGGIQCIATSTLDIRNSIIRGNTADVWPDCFIGTGVTMTATCVDPLQPGIGNTDADPQFASPQTGDYRLLPGSPCIDAGTNYVWMDTATDLDAKPRIAEGTVDMGSYESSIGALACNAIADVPEGPGPRSVVLRASVEGTNTASLYYVWDLNGDGTADLAGFGLSTVTGTYPIGRFDVSLVISNEVGETATVTKAGYIKVGPMIAYVRPAGSVPTYPYTNWATAATNIQAAADAGEIGTVVLVTDGTYRAAAPLTLTRGVVVRSVRGPAWTALDGRGSNRCVVFRQQRAVVDGFTIKNGYVVGQNGFGGGGAALFGGGRIQNSVIVSNATDNYGSGGGVACFFGGSISNCVVSHNSGADQGGGVMLHGPSTAEVCSIVRNTGMGHGGGLAIIMGGVARRCTIGSNLSMGQGGGINIVDGGRVEACLVESNSAPSGYSGGGIAVNYLPAVIDRCVIRGNSCSGYGGGVYGYGGGQIANCSIYSNTANYAGGGVALYTGNELLNCTLLGNSGGNYGGGIYTEGSFTTRNTIVYFNTASTGSNVYESGHRETWFNNCVAPIPGGTGNIDVNPQVALITGGVWRLLVSSPCIDAGDTNNAPIADIEGIARPLDGNADSTVGFDIGASEFASTNVDADADGLSDGAEAYVWHTGALVPDSDGDAMRDGAEIIAGTDPMNTNSFLGMQGVASPPSASGTILSWSSVAGKFYSLSRTTNLVAGFGSPFATHIQATPPLNLYTDSTVVATAPVFYRIGVEP